MTFKGKCVHNEERDRRYRQEQNGTCGGKCTISEMKNSLDVWNNILSIEEVLSELEVHF